MGLVPIKLLKNTVGRKRLLKIKGEDAEIDKNDYIESRINTNAKARDLLAIEDGSEMAKFFLHKKGRGSKLSLKISKKSLVKNSNSSSVKPVSWRKHDSRVSPLVRVLTICL